MAKILYGAPVAAELCEKVKADVAEVRARGITPALAILRVGARPEDSAYERGATKRCVGLGIDVKSVVLDADVSQSELMRTIASLNADRKIHGILLLRPLPAALNEKAACAAIEPCKDIDGVTGESLAALIMGREEGFAPCTARACMELLRHYGVKLRGSRAVVVGRSLVVGRPTATLLLREDATVTVCHSKTENMAESIRGAEIVVAAAGCAGLIGADCLAPGQTIIDAGINSDAETGKPVGDVCFAEACDIVSAITPVPGGVGAVTTAVLAGHVAQAALRNPRGVPPSVHRLKIGIFVDTYFPMIDGVVMCVDNYATYLSAYADVTVFTTVVERGFEDDRPYKIVRCFSLPVPGEDYVVPTPALDKDFWDELQSSQLDIVHINSPFTVGLAGARYARKHNVPMVATMHSQFHTDFRRALKMQPLVELALDEIVRLFDEADEVWVPNSAVGNLYKNYGGRREPIVHYNATDMRPVPDIPAARARVNAKYGLDDGETMFLFVGRLVLHKNILFVADAISELRKKTDAPFRMLFVGSGPDEGDLRERIAELGLGGVVTLTGRVTDRTELAELYCRADMFLFPSRYDANSLVQIEAASQSTPTVFLRGAVTSATAEDGISGYFAENDTVLYAQMLADIMTDPERHQKVCEGAFRDVYRSWDQVIAGMLTDYRRLIDEYNA
ncbi:MAG: tetrahydrofolate dehydrogenase/cyclohydrolase catalytic domain-containing protein, partial [Oscillospiraceae bacterium]